MIRLLIVATCVAVLLATAAAFAGEVKGPPNIENNENVTAAPAHANSPCAFSGLNDFDEHEGQNVSQVQTPADSWKYYGLPKGFVGQACRGGGSD